ncbi:MULTISPECIES: type III secretion system stalk subunit SctO [unclassified Pseudomonas]|uniref:type III secretion system stalk subunit SctO n=1 Tax=unclassified Pseudomonas TaxID=196821 RepID=UPI0019446006|nr:MULTISPECIES: YscO family type III secretion system apparatus protein [unclassified Pseudomonas]MCE0917204.1 type III secretion protein [Pseudomonas sp. NMI760_13]MCP8635524.1 type III secretion protein [Pseudomonas sp. DVZ6]MDC0690345.1 YscO family type III secretion system apparatus protein [Mitsuaria sp. RG]MDD7786967.1 YscO family type III secretion system apparatus protein [Pseudomonas sp. DVZ24]BCJ06272.1 preprotein translocase O [Pseudomonas sp. RtIB026]
MPLTTLLSIKQRRLQRAEHEARNQQARLQAAQADKAKSLEAHLTYRCWSREEEQRLFDAQVGRLTKRHDLEQWRRQVGLLGEREASLRGQVVACENALARQHTARQQAQAKLAQARQQLDSFKQLHEQASRQAARRTEHSQELEVEECHGQGGSPC